VGPESSSVQPMHCVHMTPQCGVQQTPCWLLRQLRRLNMPFRTKIFSANIHWSRARYNMPACAYARCAHITMAACLCA